MTDWKVGDRVELVSMGKDPDPIEPGTKGTIDYVGTHLPLASGGETHQIAIRWDNGRGLAVLIPPDVIRKITDD